MSGPTVVDTLSERELEAILEVWGQKPVLGTAVRDLVATVRRLRGLIEWTAPKAYQTDHGDRVRSLHEPCPWCNRYPCETVPGGHKDCPAFTESGDVR